MIRGRQRGPLYAAVSAALASVVPLVATQAQEAEPPPQEESGAALEVIIVTATRRDANIQSIPFNIAAVGPDTIDRQRLDDLAELTRVVPGLYLANQGPRSSNLMTVRGLNVSSVTAAESVGNGTGNTVATYIGEIPLYVDLKMIDIERVEALLGPQGTLYGAGTLGGAIRYLPNRPDPARSDADVNARFYALNHSDGFGYDVDGALNVPLIQDRLAVRVAALPRGPPGTVWLRAVCVPGAAVLRDVAAV